MVVLIQDESKTLLDTVFIYQAQKNELVLTQDSYIILSEGETINAELKTNVDYEIIIPEDAQGWIKQIVANSLRIDNVMLDIEENPAYDKRFAKITIKDKNSSLTDTLYITQKQKNALILSENEFNLPMIGGNVSIEVQSNVEFNVVIPEHAKEWIQQIEARSLQSDVLHFKIKENPTYEIREANIVIQDKKSILSDTIRIQQACKDYLIVSPKEFHVASKGGNIYASVKSNQPFSVYKLNGYEDFVSYQKNDEQGSLAIMVPGNALAIERVQKLKIVSNNLSDTITITLSPYEGEVIHYGNVEFNKGADIKTLIGYNKIQGNVYIRNKESNYSIVRSLEALVALKEITGDLIIENTSLQNLSGLENLEKIGGSLIIRSNSELSSIEFENLCEVGNSSISVINNPSLENWDNTEKLQEIQYLEIRNNGKLKTILGLKNIHTIRKKLTISGTDLENLDDLQNLEFLGSLFLRYNSRLNSITGLSRLTGICDIVIEGNPQLRTYAGLGNLLSVEGRLELMNNIDIVGIFDGLRSIKNNLSIKGNVNDFNSLTSVQDISVNGNVSGFNSLVIARNIYVQGDLYDGFEKLEQVSIIELLAKSEGLNNLTLASSVFVNTPIGLNKIQSVDNLTVSGKIDDNAFENLQMVGSFTIKDTANIYGFRNLKTIKHGFTNEGIVNGFHSLEKVGGKFMNYGMLYGFNKLSSVEGDFEQGGRMEGTIELQHIGGDLVVTDNFNGFEHLVTLNSSLNVDNIKGDFSFKGLESLQMIGGNLNLIELYDRKLTSFQGLNSLQIIKGNLEINKCYKFESFEGLNQLKKIGGNFIIGWVSEEWKSFDALSNLIEIGGDFAINNLNGFKNLQYFCLEKLERIGGTFIPKNLNRLKELKMPSLKNIGGDFLLLEFNSGYDSSINLEKLQNVQGSLSINSERSFSINLPQLQNVNGDFSLETPYTLDINGLDQLQRVSGTFLLKGRYKGICNFLNLESVGGLSLEMAYAILEFPVLKIINHDVYLKVYKDNYGIEEGTYTLNSLEEIQGSLLGRGTSEKIELQSLRKIGGDLTISLKNLVLNNLRQVEGSVSSDPYNSLKNLESIGKDLRVCSLEGFSGLQSVKGQIQLSCKSLSSLEGLN